MKTKTLWIILISALLLLLSGCDGEPVRSTNGDGFFSSENLDAAKNYSIDQTDGNALIIWQDGDILLEEYEGVTAQIPLPILGATKSFAGMLAAFGVREGRFNYDDRIGQIIPNWEQFSDRGEITVRELLNLTSGLRTVPQEIIQNQTPQVWNGTNMEFTRGSTFSYGPTPFYIFSWIHLDILQVNPVIALNNNLFEPLGLNSWAWEFQLAGRFPNLSYGLSLQPRELLEIGKMFNNGGTLNGVEIFTSSQLNQMLAPSSAAPGYTTTFWLNTIVDQDSNFINRLPERIFNAVTSNRLISEDAPSDLYMMAGDFGQRLYIIPSQDLVIVRYGSIESSMYNDHEFFSRLYN